MAIFRPIQSQYGVVISYWKVTVMNIDWHNKRCEVVLAGYYDEASRFDNKSPIEYRAFMFEGTEFYPTLDGNNVQETYDRLDYPIYDSNGNDINVFIDSVDLVTSDALQAP
jgi:hypothetical protein